MKKKVAFLLAATMVLALPMLAYAATDDEIADIEAAVEDVNSEEAGNVEGNATYYEAEDGEVTYEKNLGFYERDEDGSIVFEKDADGNIMAEEQIVSDPDPADIGEEGEKVISVPASTTKTTLGVVSGDIEDGYFAEVTKPSLTINPATDSANVKSYAVVMVDYTDNSTVKWMVTGIVPDANGNIDISTGTENKQFESLTGDGTLHGYRIVVYALSDNTAIIGDTLADLQGAIKGKIVSQARIQGSYRGSDRADLN